MRHKREAAFSTILVLVALAFSLCAAELMIRFKNSSMNNYDIEMWRYSRELKTQSPDPALDFDHVHSKSALLQHVDIRVNNWGLRGADVGAPESGKRRILVLGGSITLGWGVAEPDTMSSRLEQKFRAAGDDVQVLNAGVGNYNAERYVSRFFKELSGLQPTDIVVHYFLRDAEQLPPGGGNFLLRHSELAVTLWVAHHRWFDRQGEQSLVDHYRDVYQTNTPGFDGMKQSLRRLAGYAEQNNIRIYLAMVPDVHNLVDYKFNFVHELMRNLAKEDGYTFVDLLLALQGRPPAELWAMPGDPHPNSLGHRLMAEALFPVLDSEKVTPHDEAK
jgi:lysophospholipase L1-like esterase